MSDAPATSASMEKGQVIRKCCDRIQPAQKLDHQAVNVVQVNQWTVHHTEAMMIMVIFLAFCLIYTVILMLILLK